MAQDGRFEGDAIALRDLVAALVDVAAGGGDHPDMVVGVDPAGDSQSQQLQPRVAVLVRIGVAVGQNRADLHAADARFEVELAAQRLGDELLFGQGGQDLLGVDV